MRNRRDRRTNSVIASLWLVAAKLLIDLLLLGRDAHEGAEQIVADRLAVGGGRESKSFALKNGAGEQPALIRAGDCECLHQIVEAALNQFDRPAQHQFLIPCRTGFDSAEHRTRLRRERRAEQHPVDEGVFVAPIEPRTNVAVVSGDPAWPCGFELRGCERVQLGWKMACQLGQDRPGFAEADEPGRRDSGRSGQHTAGNDQQQDAGNPKVGGWGNPISDEREVIRTGRGTLVVRDYGWRRNSGADIRSDHASDHADDDAGLLLGAAAAAIFVATTYGQSKFSAPPARRITSSRPPKAGSTRRRHGVSPTSRPTLNMMQAAGVPLERCANATRFGGAPCDMNKAWLTEEELKERIAIVAGRGDLGRQLIEKGEFGRALLSGVTDPATPQRQTTLIVDPPNGLLPALTP